MTTMQCAMFLLMIVAGMVGLYFKVEYSGWVLFFGLAGVLFV